VVVDLLGPHGADDAEVIGNAADAREELAHLLAGFAVGLELVLRAKADQRLALQLRDLLSLGHRRGHRLAVHRGELGFVVEGLEVGRSAGLIEEDYALGFRRVVQRIYDALRAETLTEQLIESEEAESGDAAA